MEQTDGKEILAKAKTFIYENGRLLDRRIFEYEFGGGSANGVLQALKAYQNEDGGFGNALEADIRCPDSQPVPTEYALEIQAEVGFDRGILEGIIRYLGGLALPGGGFPYARSSLLAYPHAPWWHTDQEHLPSINPTGRIIGLLYQQQLMPEVTGLPWFRDTLEFVWRTLEQELPTHYHDATSWIAFLEHTPEQERALAVRSRLDKWLQEPGIIELNPVAEGYVQKVLDWAPSPTSYATRLIPEGEINRHLDAMVTGQQEDGGWLLNFPAVSPAGGLEWRGTRTVNNLKILRAYGRL